MAQLVVDGFPDRITEKKIPVVGLHINIACERRSNAAIGVFDLRMIDTKRQLFVFRTLNVQNESKFHIDDCCDASRIFECLGKFTRLRIPLSIGAKGSNSESGFCFGHQSCVAWQVGIIRQ